MNWFKKIPLVYLPVSLPGAIVLLSTIAICAWFFVAIDRHSHSVSDTLISFFPYAVCTWCVYGWIARNTSN